MSLSSVLQVLVLDRPLTVSEDAQIFNLNLDDVCALVEATGRSVANNVAAVYNKQTPFPGNFMSFATCFLYLYMRYFILLSSSCSSDTSSRSTTSETQ